MYRPSRNVGLIVARMTGQGFTFGQVPTSVLRLAHDGLVDVFLVTPTGDDDLGARFRDHTTKCRRSRDVVLDRYEEVTLGAPIGDLVRPGVHVYETNTVHDMPRRIGFAAVPEPGGLGSGAP